MEKYDTFMPGFGASCSVYSVQCSLVLHLEPFHVFLSVTRGACWRPARRQQNVFCISAPRHFQLYLFFNTPIRMAPQHFRNSLLKRRTQARVFSFSPSYGAACDLCRTIAAVRARINVHTTDEDGNAIPSRSSPQTWTPAFAVVAGAIWTRHG